MTGPSRPRWPVYGTDTGIGSGALILADRGGVLLDDTLGSIVSATLRFLIHFAVRI